MSEKKAEYSDYGLTGLSARENVVDTKSLQKGEDEDGNKTINEYAVISELGRGAYGKVKLVTHTATDQWYAIKIMNKHVLSKVRKGASGKTAMDDVYREIAIMKALDHPNVVKLHEVINDPDSKKLYLIIDFIENGPIWSVGEAPLKTEDVRKHLVGMCQGLDYLHTQNILHRDIKPDNLLVDGDGNVKWCDFGVSAARDADGDGEDDDVLDTEGTPAFLSPEQCTQTKVPGRMVDMWALGVTLYCITYGQLPFSGRTVPQMMESIASKPATFEDCGDAALQDLIEGMLRKSLEERVGWKGGVREILRHRILKGTKGAEEVEHKKIKLSENMDWFRVVKKGKNIKLSVSSSVGVGLKLEQMKQKLNKLRQRGKATDIGVASPRKAAEEPSAYGPEKRSAEWSSSLRYMEEKGVARLIDTAVRELVAARPSDVAQWLSTYFEQSREASRK